MKKTFAFVLTLAVLVAALAGTGCKPRDAKKLALALAPVASVNPCNVSNFVASIGPDQWCQEMFYDTYSSDNVFNACGIGEYNSPDQVFAITVPYAMVVDVVASGEGYPCISVRRNCDPNDDSAIVGSTYGSGWAEMYLELEPGTYYVVIESLYGAFEYWWGLCGGSPDSVV